VAVLWTDSSDDVAEEVLTRWDALNEVFLQVGLDTSRVHSCVKYCLCMSVCYDKTANTVEGTATPDIPKIYTNALHRSARVLGFTFKVYGCHVVGQRAACSWQATIAGGTLLRGSRGLIL